MSELLATVSNWAPNRWLMGGGFALMVLSVVSSLANIEIVAEMRMASFAGGLALVLLGAWYAREAARYAAMDKRSTPRPLPEPSAGTLAALEWLKQQTRPISKGQLLAANFPYDDKRKVAELKGALLVSRLNWWADARPDEVKRIGDEYSLRGDTDMTVGTW